ncbi:MAG: enoyl-CoA hydratase/isomerase family protein [Actinomycetia bacterium]|nr:enoyl-CoA hydratase/isomerase family protein [Actinomycetes bacterium]MCP4959013.1 enoyl-CoA hydratase/isomerase family protein [Actinomycetes bacterium]
MTDVHFEVIDGVAVLALARPERANALRRATIAEFDETLARIEEDLDSRESVRGVMITGQGPRFSAGADVDELSGTVDDVGFDDDLEALTGRIARLSVPVVAAVEGACFGAAIDLAWACDLVVVSRTARLGLPATRLGILYNPVSMGRLHARLGSVILRRLTVVGEELDGAAVGSAGAARVVEPGAAREVALDLLSRASGVPNAVAATKALLATLDAEDFDPTDWQPTRHELLAAEERSVALKSSRESLGKNQA